MAGNIGIYGDLVRSYNFIRNGDFRTWLSPLVTIPGTVAKDWVFTATGSAERSEDTANVRSLYGLRLRNNAGIVTHSVLYQDRPAVDSICFSGQHGTFTVNTKITSGLSSPLNLVIYTCDQRDEFSAVTEEFRHVLTSTYVGNWDTEEVTVDFSVMDMRKGIRIAFERTGTVEYQDTTFSAIQLNVGRRATPFEYMPYIHEIDNSDASDGFRKMDFVVADGQQSLDINDRDASAVQVVSNGITLRENLNYTFNASSGVITLIGGMAFRGIDEVTVLVMYNAGLFGG